MLLKYIKKNEMKWKCNVRCSGEARATCKLHGRTPSIITRNSPKLL